MKALDYQSDNGKFQAVRTGLGKVVRRTGGLVGLHVKSFEEVLELSQFLQDLVHEWPEED